HRDEAWAVFHARYRGVILRWCLRRGLPADLTQEVLLKLFRRLPQYKHDPARGQYRAWLKVVVNNALTDFGRRQRRRPEGGPVGGTAFLARLGALAGPDAAGDRSDVIGATPGPPRPRSSNGSARSSRKRPGRPFTRRWSSGARPPRWRPG